MMKNKMFTRVLGMTCALIMAVTAIVPVCAKESGDQANSFRYENGQAAMQASTFGRCLSECMEENCRKVSK